LVETQAGANTYRWIYSDNTTSTGHNPARTIAPNEAFTLIIDNGMGTKDTLTGTEIILACSVDNFTITYLSNGQIRFELPGYNPVTSEYILKWEFSDGSTSTGEPGGQDLYLKWYGHLPVVQKERQFFGLPVHQTIHH
jgi:hypothetical protein